MATGLQNTLEVLTNTANDAAVQVLIPALEGGRREVQEAALRAILARRSITGQREILRRLHEFDENWKSIVREGRGRMSQALRDAVLDSDDQLCRNACQAILWFEEYDLIPTLVTAVEDDTNPNVELVAKTLLSLCELLYDELAAPRDYQLRRDPQLVRRNVTGSLEDSAKRFGKHKRQEIVESFLLLAGRENATLVQILLDPLHTSYVPLIQLLTHSSRPGVMRLVLSYLEYPQAPSAMINVLAHRTDKKFVEILMRKIGAAPSAPARTNLKRIESIPWLRPDFALLDELDDNGQHSAIQLLTASKVKQTDAYPVIEHALNFGKTGGRRAAAAALAGFHGTDANNLALEALRDTDPQVQATILAQLRQRNIPGALTTLLGYVDSPHHVVRQAARESLSEFGFQRYLAAFDMLDEDAARSTGLLVKRIDLTAIPQLRQELQSSNGKRKMRALRMARAMSVVPQIEDAILEIAGDDDHLLRTAAVDALADCDSLTARNHLEHALHDRSLVVQEAARSSLDQIGRRRGAEFGATGPFNSER